MSDSQPLNPYIQLDSPTHRLDSRIKLSLVFVYILTINLIPHAVWVVFPILFSVNLSLAVVSGIGIKKLLKRSLWVLPFVFAAFPLLFSTKGNSWFEITLFGFSFTASWEGFERLLSIVLKAWFSIQAAVILVSTTKFEGILKGLRWIKIPKLLVAVIGLMWRYLFVLVAEAKRLLVARSSRSSDLPDLHSGGRMIWRAQVTGYMAGNLLLRSIERSDRVYMAMLSRGYDGEVRMDNDRVLSRKEIHILLIGILICVCLFVLSLYFGGVF